MFLAIMQDENICLYPQIDIIFIDPLLKEMIKIRSRSLSEIQRPQTSSTCYKSRLEASREFIPFHQERDTMGRLLKSSKSNQNNVVVYDSMPSETQYVPKKSEKKLQEKINKYFQMSRLPLPSYELEKTKILKKTMISIPVTQNLPKRQSKKLSMEDRMAITDEKEVMLSRQFSRTNWQQSQKPQLGIKRMKSSIIPRGNLVLSPPKNTNSSKQITSSSQAALLPKKIDLNLEKFVELNRYHRWQELEVKTYSNFQQGHTKFLQKIRESKKLAFDVRINLDKIDALC